MKKRLTALLVTLGILAAFLPAPVHASMTYQYYYQQLDAYGKEIYELVASNTAALMANQPVILEKDLTKTEYAQLTKSVNRAVETYLQDHPELFWCGSWGYTSQRSGSSDSSVFHYTISIILEPDSSWTAAGGRSIQTDYSSLITSASTLASGAKGAGTRRYDQLLWLHDWLTRNNAYNTTAAQAGPARDSTPWSALSAMDLSLSPVCEGYSRAFQLVCYELGIPCVLVTGGEHMWNYVQMEDQKWYAVDITYDDPVYTIGGMIQPGLISGGENHDYFLIGNKLFTDHKTDPDYTYPTLSATDYDPAQTSAVSPAQPVTPQPAVSQMPVPQVPVINTPVVNIPTAYPSIQTVTVDGEPVEFQMYAIKNGDGLTNYVKLRDLALVLNGTAARFAVGWDGQSSTIDLTPGAPYVPTGSEMHTPYSGPRAYTPAQATTRIYGIPIQINAITLQDDAGNGYTYYKLRDLGTALGFLVDWSPERGVYVETSY